MPLRSLVGVLSLVRIIGLWRTAGMSNGETRVSSRSHGARTSVASSRRFLRVQLVLLTVLSFDRAATYSQHRMSAAMRFWLMSYGVFSWAWWPFDPRRCLTPALIEARW